MALRAVCPYHPKRTTVKLSSYCRSNRSLRRPGPLVCLRSRAGLRWASDRSAVPLLIRSKIILNYWESGCQSKLLTHMPHVFAACAFCFFFLFLSLANQEINVWNQTIGKFIWRVWLARFTLAFAGDCLSNRQFQQFGFIWRNYGVYYRLLVPCLFPLLLW